MKSEILPRLIGQELGYWKIVNVHYEGISKMLYLLLQLQYSFVDEKKLKGKSVATSNLKKIIIYDVFEFNFWVENKMYNCFEDYLKRNNGIHKDDLNLLKNKPQKFYTTSIQYYWINILQNLNVFDKEKYHQQLISELKKHFLIYVSEHPEVENVDEMQRTLEDIEQNVNNIQV